jgi:hypothetical protein
VPIPQLVLHSDQLSQSDHLQATPVEVVVPERGTFVVEASAVATRMLVLSLEVETVSTALVVESLDVETSND